MNKVIKLKKKCADMGNCEMQNVFGESAAESEWAHNPERARNVFIHTDAYESFSKDNILFMFGRRGTGKTAILQMTKAAVNSKTYVHKYFKCAEIIDEHDAFYDISWNSRNSPIAQNPIEDLIHFYKKQWLWIVRVTAMQSLYLQYSSYGDARIEKVKKYLKANDLLESDGCLTRMSKVFSECVRNIENDYVKLAGAFNELLIQMKSPAYDEALAALRSFLRKEKGYALIMLDSVEDFRHNDTIVRSILSACIKAASELDIRREKERIVLKIAFPTEMQSKIRKWHREKVDGKLIFILWKYSQLVSLIAKRYCYRVGGGDPVDCSKRYSDYEEAKKFVYEFIPSVVTSPHGVKLDTMAHVIRHTQKRPRQLIQIFNNIYNFAGASCEDMTIRDEETLNNGIHYRLDLVVGGTLGIYDKIYERSEEFIRRVFTDKKCIFSYNELHSYIKEASSFKDDIFNGNSQVESFLLETGLVGIVTEKSVSHKFDVVWYNVQFEYQVRNVLTMTNKSLLAIHPSMYHELCCEVDLNDYVYPQSNETEEINTLVGLGVCSD